MVDINPDQADLDAEARDLLRRGGRLLAMGRERSDCDGRGGQSDEAAHGTSCREARWHARGSMIIHPLAHAFPVGQPRTSRDAASALGTACG